MLEPNDQPFWTFPPRLALSAACLIVLGSLAGCGAKISPEQKAAMVKIQDLGGRVNYLNGGYKVDLTKTPFEDRDLESLKHIARLKNIDLQGTQITDEGLEHLLSIETLEYISVQRTGVTHEGADKLKKALPKADVRL